MRPCLCDKETCRLCWLYHNDQRYKILWDAANFARAAIKHIASGIRHADDATQQKRTSICNSCEFKSNNHCLKCSCNLAIKIRWQTSKCPMEKW